MKSLLFIILSLLRTFICFCFFSCILYKFPLDILNKIIGKDRERGIIYFTGFWVGIPMRKRGSVPQKITIDLCVTGVPM